jgi:DNA-binding GntR family transcriptional regulator
MTKDDEGGSGTPSYLEVLATIRKRIGDGTYRVKIPAGKALAEELRVAESTVSHAVAILKDDGVLRSEGNRGTFINLELMDSDGRMST